MVNNYKQKITTYLNNRDNEDYSVLDIFQNIDIRHGGIHPFGYKLLKNEYKFIKVEVTNFCSTPTDYLLLSNFIKGMYYITKPKDKVCNIYLTDSYCATMLGLSNDFNEFAKMHKEY